MTVTEKIKLYLGELSDDKLMQIYNDFATAECYPHIKYMYAINDALHAYLPSDILRMTADDFDIDNTYYIMHDDCTVQSSDNVLWLIGTEIALDELVDWLYENEYNEAIERIMWEDED